MSSSKKTVSNKNTKTKTNKTQKNTFSTVKTSRSPVCDTNMTFNECELAILRIQADKAKEKLDKRRINSPEIKKMISIVEQFIRNKKSIVYGGTALNNILPEEDQFYDKELEIPDYDFFSPNALDDAKELADIFFENGFQDCEAKSGMHHGTYKVFVNYIPIADITYLVPEIFYALKRDTIERDNILYAPVNFLRMSIYLELSRPAGDVERWNKVYDRLQLLNKHYPFNSKNCSKVEFQRGLEVMNKDTKNSELSYKIYDLTKETFIKLGCVFFGGYAISQYSQYMPPTLRKRVQKYADFDVLSYQAKETAYKLKDVLNKNGINNVKVIKRDPVGEIVPLHYEIKVGIDTIAFVYEPIACHSYNVIKVKNEEGIVGQEEKVKIATIDTMLTFYLAFLYSGRPYYNAFIDRPLCMAAYLFEVQQQNRLEQKGLLQRFSITCYGHQPSVEEVKEEKAHKYLELKDKKGTREYEKWFLNYKPFKKFMGIDDTDTNAKTIPLNERPNERPILTKTSIQENKKVKLKEEMKESPKSQVRIKKSRRNMNDNKNKKRNINPYTKKRFNLKRFLNNLKSKEQNKY
jgi:hypothetical protein